jgi:putative ABC transport system permease protein
MGLATTLARRSLLQRPARTLLSILGIAVGIATVVGVYTLDTNTIRGLQERYSGSDAADWKPELEVSPAPGLENPRAALDAIEGVAGAAVFFQNEVVLELALTSDGATRAPAPMRARMLAVDAGVLPSMNAYELLAGEDLGTDSDLARVLIGPSIAEALALDPGMRLEIARPTRAAPRVCIDGELQHKRGASPEAPPSFTFEVAGILAPTKLGRHANGEIVVLPYEWGMRLFEGSRTSPRFWVRPDPVVNLEDLQSRLSGSFAYDMARSGITGQQADERAYRNGIYMAGLLALMLGLYVIFHTLSMSLVERIREVGVLHALGAGRRQVGRIFLLEAVILSGLGGLLGLVGGVAMAKLLLDAGVTTLGTGKHIPGFTIPFGVLPLAAIGVGTALVGSVFPLLRARGASTVDALRGEKALETSGTTHHFHIFATILIAVLLPALYFTIVPIVGETSGPLVGSILLAVGVLGLLLAVPLLIPGAISAVCRLLAAPLTRMLPFAGSMASHTMIANPRRIAVSSAAIALVCAAFVGLKGMTASLRGEVDTWAKDSIDNKVWVRNLPESSYDELSAALHELPEVLGVEAGSARAYSSFLLLGLRSEELSSYGPFSKTPALRRAFDEDHGMILSERAAKNGALGIGARIPVKVGSGEVVDFKVIAISDEYGYFPHPDERSYGLVSERYMKRYFCVDIARTDYLAVRTTDEGDPGAIEAVVLDALGGRGNPNFLTGAGLRDIQVKDIRRDFMLFDLILGLTALLAALGVLNGQLLSALERAKELGILRALGAGRAQISGMVWLESGVMGLFGGLLGLGLGALLTPIIIRALETLSGLELQLHGAGVWNWITLGSAIVVTLLAGVYPVWRMNRTDSVRAIRIGG